MTRWLHLEPPTAARSAHGNLTDPRERASMVRTSEGQKPVGPWEYLLD